MLHNLSLRIFEHVRLCNFSINIDCNRNNFLIWCSNIQNVALYKHYNTELNVVMIDMTLSEKTITGKTKYFCKYVENDYSTLNCHPNQHLNFFSQRVEVEGDLKLILEERHTIPYHIQISTHLYGLAGTCYRGSNKTIVINKFNYFNYHYFLVYCKFP